MTTYTPTTWLNAVTGVSPTRMNNIETGVDNAHKELQHPVTYVVAASNSTADEISAADYACDGTNDEVEINNAINAAAAISAAGGRIVLLGGTYVVGSSIVLKTNIILEGAGWATIIKPGAAMASTVPIMKNNASAAPDDSGIIIRDLMLDGNRATVTNFHMGVYFSYASYCTIKNVHFKSLNDSCVKILAAGNNTIGNHVINCKFTDMYSDNFNENAVANIYYTGYGIIIESCYFDLSATQAFNWGIIASGDRAVIKNNYMLGGSGETAIMLYNNDTVITGNIITQFFMEQIWGYGARNTITNNIIIGGDVGISLQGASNCVISNNIITTHATNGVKLMTASINNIITGNVIRDNGTLADNTQPQIFITGNSVRNLVKNNLVRKAAAGNRAKYGIQIDAGSNYNIVVHNDIYDSGVTGAILNNGTSTVITLSGNQTT